MEAIAARNCEIMVDRPFDNDLFKDFVAWIDRGEQTTRTYLNNLRQFMAWLQYTGIKKPTRQDILSYRAWLSIEHKAITLDASTEWSYRTNTEGEPIKVTCKPNTINAYLRTVGQFFKWAAANGLYPDIAANIHAPKVRHDTHHKEALTASEVLTIENSIKERASIKVELAQSARKDTAGRTQRSTEQGKRLYAMYLLAVNAGLRTVEISRANVKDMVSKGENHWMYVWGKGHSEPDQKKAIAPEVAVAIRDYLASRTDSYNGMSPLFVSTGNRSGGRRIAPTTISTMLKKAMKEAGFDSERITAHSLRHTAGTAVQEITGNLYTTQQYMRHSNPATTEIYLHNDTEKTDTTTARQLFNFYHGKNSEESREKLEMIISKMTPTQIDQLAGIASAIAG